MAGRDESRTNFKTSIRNHKAEVILNRFGTNIYLSIIANNICICYRSTVNTRVIILRKLPIRVENWVCLCCGKLKCYHCGDVILDYIQARTNLLLEIIADRELLEFEIRKTCERLGVIIDGEITPESLNSICAQTLTKRAQDKLIYFYVIIYEYASDKPRNI